MPRDWLKSGCKLLVDDVRVEIVVRAVEQAELVASVLLDLDTRGVANLVLESAAASSGRLSCSCT
ncbi:MAG TPA: hypothetical protein DIW77_13215 [Chromatiaceae bacterium]|nr:MAG: hypothetical protein N838_23090 [Thiohalocapsa sp. PB-PSB1]HCS90961.1 hypothetical protein [Chromatiaceae bacterium]